MQGVQICAGGGCGNDAGVLVGRRLHGREESGHEQLGEVEVADDVGAPLEIVTFMA